MQKESKMDDFVKQRKFWILGIHWVTRVLATLLTIMVLVIFLGEGLSSEGSGNPFKHSLSVQLEFLGIFIVWVGMIIGWKWEGIASGLIIGGMMIFHIVQGKFWLNWTFGLFDMTGILFLLSWWLKRFQQGRVES